MTKVTILGQAEAAEPKKKIEFKQYLNSVTDDDFDNPCDYDNVQLIARSFFKGLDFMVAWDNKSPTMACILGHFNDGVV